MRFARLIEYQPVPLPEELPRERAYVLVANHPTLLDVVFLVAM